MEFEQGSKKEIWSAPQIFILDFKNTKSGDEEWIEEDYGGDIYTG